MKKALNIFAQMLILALCVIAAYLFTVGDFVGAICATFFACLSCVEWQITKVLENQKEFDRKYESITKINVQAFVDAFAQIKESILVIAKGVGEVKGHSEFVFNKIVEYEKEAEEEEQARKNEEFVKIFCALMNGFNNVPEDKTENKCCGKCNSDDKKTKIKKAKGNKVGRKPKAKTETKE